VQCLVSLSDGHAAYVIPLYNTLSSKAHRQLDRAYASQNVLKVGSLYKGIHVAGALGSPLPIPMVVYMASEFSETL
jgi:hypothetical protein